MYSKMYSTLWNNYSLWHHKFWNTWNGLTLLSLVSLRSVNFSLYLPNNIRKGKNLKTTVKRKQSTPNFPKNEHFLSGGKKYPFFGRFGVLCFLLTAVLRFALYSYYRCLKTILTMHFMFCVLLFNISNSIETFLFTFMIEKRFSSKRLQLIFKKINRRFCN